MRIGIDGEILSSPPCGMKRYTFNLIKNLASICKDSQFFLLLSKKVALEFTKDHNNIKQIYPPKLPFISYRKLWKNKICPFIINKAKVDLIHFPANFVTPNIRSSLFNCKVVVTIHDILPLVLNNYYDEKSFQKYLKNIKFTVENYDLIITVSNYSKNDIVNFLKIPEHKIKVIYEGVEESFYQNYDQSFLSRTVKKYNLPDEFLLYVGGNEKRKNVEVIVKSYEILMRTNILRNIKLLIVGDENSYIKSIKEIVEKSGLQREVIFLSYLPEDVMPIIYRLAKIFIYPSLYEGFGLPPLEAMACGVPVITSNTSSLPEVVGDAAILVDPYDIEEIADAMYRILTNKELKNNLIEKGLKRVELFSWKKTAEETLKVYEEVMKK